MHWLILVGIAFIAIGTLLTYLGSNYQSNKVSNEIINKIDSTNEKIKELKKDPEINKGELQIIENEFDSWASRFVQNKDSYKLKIEKDNVNSKETEINLSHTWLPFYENFFNTLDKMIKAYNTHSKHKIVVGTYSLPSSLFSEEVNNFIFKVSFKENMHWAIFLTSLGNQDYEILPMISICQLSQSPFDKQFSKKKVALFNADLSFYPNLQNSKIRIFYNRFRIKEIQDEYDLINYQAAIKDLIRLLFEHQLALLN